MPAPAQPAQKRSRRDTRHQLLQLGLQLFGTRSYADISIDDIARAAGISRGLLYHYFPDKRAFYLESVRLAAARLLERLRPAAELAPEERLREALSGYLAFVEAFAPAYSTLLRGGLGFDAAVAEIVEETREVIVDDLLADLGRPRAPLFRVAVRAWVGMVETACLDWLANRSVAREELIELWMVTLRAVLDHAAGRVGTTPLALLTRR